VHFKYNISLWYLTEGKKLRNEKKIRSKLGVILVSILIIVNMPVKLFPQVPASTSVSQEVNTLFSADIQTIYGHSAFGGYAWARQGDSITYSYSASASIWVYVMDESQWFSFTEENMLGTLLSTSPADTGVFYPQYEARWYIVFFNYHSYTVSLDYDLSFSPIILVTNPTSATQILTESALMVTWESYNGISGEITIDLYKGGAHVATLDGLTINDGNEYCTIPETCVDGNDYRIKLTAPSSSEVDYSSYFSITQRKVKLYRPNADSVFVPYSKSRIEWSSIGTSSRVKIDLYVNDSFYLEITNDTENMLFPWNVWVGDEYAHITSSNYQIRIQDALNPKYFAISPNFTILSVRSLSILSPTINSTMRAGDTLQVQWESNTPCNEVYISLLRGDVVIKNITTRNTGSYSFTLSPRLGGDNEYKIQITAVDNSTSASSDYFTIIPKLRIPGYNITILFLSIIFIPICLYIKKLRQQSELINIGSYSIS
jgi:hypothetical protein